MDIPILIAKTLGVYLIASGAFLILRGRTFPVVLKDMFEHRATMWLAGLFLIVIGGLIVFEGSEDMIVMLLGWATLLKGVIYIIYPDIFIKISSRKAFHKLTGVWGMLYVALGFWLASL
jgi:uncharacterized membrane protein HdeD (DUF308 family)